MTQNTINPLANVDLVELERRLNETREEARLEYVDRDTEAYHSRGALRGDLCLLYAAARFQRMPTAFSLAELRALEEAGLLGPTSQNLTEAGRTAASAALLSL